MVIIMSKSIVEKEALRARNLYLRNEKELREFKKIRRRFLSYKANAERRKIYFSLTLSDFKIITNQRCYYCGDFGNNGIDRVDNNNGYLVGNIAPCCKLCNISKGNRNVNDFISHAYKIASYSEKNMQLNFGNDQKLITCK